MLRTCMLLVVLAGPAFAQANWGAPTGPADEGFSWTDPIAPGFWMAWTNATAALFAFIFGAIALLTIIEAWRPGGGERRGILSLVTTRGDRLFLALLGSAYIFLAWLALVGQPVWAPLMIAVAWFVFCFWKV